MNKTRLTLFLFIVIIIIVSIVPYVFFGINNLIDQWHIPIDPPGFYDSRQLGWAAESYYQGYDPLVENPANPRGTRYNYPRIWHLLFPLVLNESSTNTVGTIVVIIFMIGVGIFWFFNKFDNLTYYFLSIIILSPAVMLGIERSNTELIVFFVVSLALTVNYYSRISGLILFLFASILKLYPVFAFVYLLKEEKRRFWKLFLLALGIFALYALSVQLVQNEFVLIYKVTPKGVSSSYGINIWWMGIGHKRFFDLPITESLELILQVFSYVLAFTIMVVTLYLSMSRRDNGQYKQGEYIDAFRVGACIYVGSFILIRTVDYRLIFMIFTIPQLVAWLRDKEKSIALVSRISLAAMVLSLWSNFIMRFLGRNITFVMEEFANWVMLAGFLYLLFSSLPEWFKDYFRWPFSFIKNSSRQSITG